jgi:hypothetical protein
MHLLLLISQLFVNLPLNLQSVSLPLILPLAEHAYICTYCLLLVNFFPSMLGKEAIKVNALLLTALFSRLLFSRA